MKKLVTLFLALVMLFPLCACGKSEAVKNVENLISAIGEVTLDKEPAIFAANRAYNYLGEDEKAQVKNYDVLDDSLTKIFDLFWETYEEGRNLIVNGEYDQGLELLLQVVDFYPIDEYAQELISEFYHFAEDEKLKEEILSKLDISVAANSFDMSNYYELLNNVNLDNINSVIEALNVQEEEEAKFYVEILQLVQDGDYYNAAMIAADAAEKYPDAHPKNKWYYFFSELLDGDIPGNRTQIEKELYREAVIAWLDSYTDRIFENIDVEYLNKNHLEEMITKNYVGAFQNDYKYKSVASLESIKSECGEDPQGKVLILRQQYDYPNRESYCAVDMWLTEKLPPEMIPASFDHVQYLLVYTYNPKVLYGATVTNQIQHQNGTGSSWDEQTDILRTDVTVELIDLKKGTVKYSKTLEGEEEADLFFGSGDGWACGKPAMCGERILDALEIIRE